MRLRACRDIKGLILSIALNIPNHDENMFAPKRERLSVKKKNPKIHDLSLPSQIKFIHCIHQPSHRWSENWLCVGMWIQAWILIRDRCKRILICICFAWTDITIFSLKKLHAKRKYRWPFTKHKIRRWDVFVGSRKRPLIGNGKLNVESVAGCWQHSHGGIGKTGLPWVTIQLYFPAFVTQAPGCSLGSLGSKVLFGSDTRTHLNDGESEMRETL